MEINLCCTEPFRNILKLIIHQYALLTEYQAIAILCKLNNNNKKMGFRLWDLLISLISIVLVCGCLPIRMHCDDLCVAWLQFQQVIFQVNIKAKASAPSSARKTYYPKRSGWANYILLHLLKSYRGNQIQLSQSTPELCVATQRVYLILGQRNSPAAINSYWIQFVFALTLFSHFASYIPIILVVTFASIEATWFVSFRFRQRMGEESKRKM